MVKFFKKLFLRKKEMGKTILGLLKSGQPVYAFEPRVVGVPTDEMRRRIAAVRRRQYREFLEHYPFPFYGTPPLRARGTLPVSMSKTRVLWCLEKIETCCGGNRYVMGTKFTPDDPFSRRLLGDV